MDFLSRLISRLLNDPTEALKTLGLLKQRQDIGIDVVCSHDALKLEFKFKRELKELRLRALKTDRLPFGSTYEETNKRPDSFWQSFAENGASGVDHAVFVACRPSLLGMVRADRSDSVIFGIYSMWVAPEVRNLGVAELLMAATEKWILESGGKSSELFVADRAPSARRLYLRCGYVENGKTDESPHPGVVEIGMTKVLAYRNPPTS